MSKEAFIAAHEALVDEYMERHPDADFAVAYEATADNAYARMVDSLADRADHIRQMRKDGLI